MSQEQIERVYTINLGKVLLSPNNQRAKRAINMIREFAVRHMKSETVKIEEDVSHLVWARGIRHPPRKIRVKLTKDDDGTVLISKYEEETKTKKEIVEEKPKVQKSEKKVEEKPTTEKVEPKPEKPTETKEEKSKTESKPEKPKKEVKSEKKSKEKPKAKSETKSKKK